MLAPLRGSKIRHPRFQSALHSFRRKSSIPSSETTSRRLRCTAVSDGLKFYRIIRVNAKPILNDRFVIAFEHAYDKKAEIQALAKAAFPTAGIETIKDMQGKDRMTIIIQK
ncbi:MAG: hypothetical protein MZU97_23215 [Bacillus subtilis]|nr:hypothetical protein [Bacillus subtilis]